MFTKKGNENRDYNDYDTIQNRDCHCQLIKKSKKQKQKQSLTKCYKTTTKNNN